MFTTNLKLIFRNLFKNKVFSTINILGLTMGLSLAIIISLWIKNELSYDHHFSNHDRIHRVVGHTQMADGEVMTFWAQPQPLYNHLKEKVAGIKNVVIQDWGFDHALKVGETKLTKSGYFASPEYFEMLDIPFEKGEAATALAKGNHIVLTQSLATNLFGNRNPLGETIRLDNKIDLLVTGVVKDLPKNSSIRFDYMLPYSVYEATNSWVRENQSNWNNSSFQILVELEEGVAAPEITQKIKNILIENQDNSRGELDLFAMNDWHLNANFENGKQAGGFIKYVRMFGLVGIIVLLIAIINFMNLSTARSEKRAREVGVRKTLGAMRSQLIGQFLLEAILLAFIATFLSVLVVDFALPYFNTLTSSAITIPKQSPIFWALLFGVSLITGVLAGSYPAFFLSAFRPALTLKNSIISKTNQGGNLARKALVVAQFSASVILVIATIVVWQQINHVASRDTGYDPNRLVMIKYEGEELYNKQAAVDAAVKSSGVAQSFTRANFGITEVYNYTDVDWAGKDPNTTVNFPMVSAQYDYTKTLGIRIKEGRDFSPDFPSDSSAVILNEAAVKALNFDSPLNEKLTIWGAERHVVGVVEDVMMLNPFEPIRPTIIQFNPYWVGSMMVRLSPNVPTQEALSSLEKIFNTHNPNLPFDYRFADEAHEKKLSGITMVGKLSSIFGLLAIFISCLGLFGLATHMAERRTKELGIRKILGASVMNLWTLLSKDFMSLILVACIIATPVAIYIMNGWLADYDYRIELHWWVFALAAILSVVIALLTISLQSVRAALINPVESLRDE